VFAKQTMFACLPPASSHRSGLVSITSETPSSGTPLSRGQGPPATPPIHPVEFCRAKLQKQGTALRPCPRNAPVRPWSFAQQNSRSGAMPRVGACPSRSSLVSHSSPEWCRYSSLERHHRFSLERHRRSGLERHRRSALERCRRSGLERHRRFSPA
jgi:hypothetical protein